jgi:hypothetical protein
MVLSFCKLLLLMVAGQLCLSTGFVVPSKSAAPSATAPPRSFLPSSVTADDTLTTTQHLPNLPFIFTQRAALSTQPPVITVDVQSSTSGTRRSLPKLHLHIEDSELGDMVDIILEMRELLPEPSVLASYGKLLEVALLQIAN